MSYKYCIPSGPTTLTSPPTLTRGNNYCPPGGLSSRPPDVFLVSIISISPRHNHKVFLPTLLFVSIISISPRHIHQYFFTPPFLCQSLVFLLGTFINIFPTLLYFSCQSSVFLPGTFSPSISPAVTIKRERDSIAYVVMYL